jgi:hypothetical protein
MPMSEKLMFWFLLKEREDPNTILFYQHQRVNIRYTAIILVYITFIISFNGLANVTHMSGSDIIEHFWRLIKIQSAS